MKNLQQLAHHPSWGLDEFVQVTNDLLPQFLPETLANTRVREEVTPRLVRHYSSLEMLDEPLKAGREARYTYRHLLQMLLVRRLLASGYGASAINQLATSKDNSELEALLQGGVQLTVTPANPALAFLQQVQQRQSVETQRNACESSGTAHKGVSATDPNRLDSRAQAQRSAGGSSRGALPPAQPPKAAAPDLPPADSPAQNQSPSSEWTRLEILPSLEIHLRKDFTYPSSPQERQNLLQHINQTLIAATIHRRSSR